MEEKATMILARSNYGATVNAHTNEIYVAGGYTNNSMMTRRCEAYNVATNTWRELPLLSEEKCSASLCVLGGRYLYCVGGFSKPDCGAYLLSTIEMLDLYSSNPKWVTLAVKLPQQICDMGAVPINATSMLLFGGW